MVDEFIEISIRIIFILIYGFNTTIIIHYFFDSCKSIVVTIYNSAVCICLQAAHGLALTDLFATEVITDLTPSYG